MTLKKTIETLKKELNEITLKDLATQGEIQEDLVKVKDTIDDFFSMLSPKAKRLQLPDGIWGKENNNENK